MHSNYTKHYTPEANDRFKNTRAKCNKTMYGVRLAMFKTHSYVRKCNLFSTRRLAFCFADVFIILLYEVMCVHLIAGVRFRRKGGRSKIYYFVFSCKLKAIHMSGKKFLVSVVD